MKTRIFVASLLLVATVASTAMTQEPTARRRLGILGGLGGAAIGAAAGEDDGDAVPGALIGGAIGLITGTVAGNAIDESNYRQQAYQAAVAQQRAQAVTMGDVVSMTQAGLSDAVIINQIQTHGMFYNMTASDLIILKKPGVRDPVLSAMQSIPQAQPVRVVRQPSPVVVREHYYTRPAPIFWYDDCYHRHYHRRHHHHHRGSSIRFSFGH